MNRFLLILVFLCAPLSAAPYTPASGDDIIAHWSAPSDDALQSIKSASRLKPNDPAIIVSLANSYLALAAQPGQSRFYGLAQAALKPLIDNNTSDKNVWLAWAQVQQHQHNFGTAQTAIAKVVAQDPANENANLLAARIYVIQEQPLLARNTCLKLLGSADLLTVTACSLEANSYLHPDDLKNTYQQLADLINHQGLPNDSRANWIIQLLADLAMRNNDSAAAVSWLSKRLDNASVNYLAQWADAQLASGNAELVLSHLTPIVTQAAEMDDALLLRLALAEKQRESKKMGNLKNSPWEKQLTERIKLREQRQDSLHSSELAQYYLDINPDPKQALYWAKINIENTREYNDKKLLARAEEANQVPGKSSIKNPIEASTKDPVDNAEGVR